MAIFDDVLVPWDRVFLHGKVELANTMFARTGYNATPGIRRRCAAWSNANS